MENTTLDAVELKRFAEVQRILSNIADLPKGGKLTFSIPTSQWDKTALSRDLTAALLAKGGK